MKTLFFSETEWKSENFIAGKYKKLVVKLNIPNLPREVFSTIDLNDIEWINPDKEKIYKKRKGKAKLSLKDHLEDLLNEEIELKPK